MVMKLDDPRLMWNKKFEPSPEELSTKQFSHVESLNQPLHHHIASFKDPDKDSQCLVYLSKWLISIKKNEWLKNEFDLLETHVTSTENEFKFLHYDSIKYSSQTFFPC